MSTPPLYDLSKASSEARFKSRSRLILVASGLVLAALAWPVIGGLIWPGSGEHASSAALPTLTPSAIPTEGEAATASQTPEQPVQVGESEPLGGTILLSLSEGSQAQIFWHRLLGEAFTRLTLGDWDDVQPAASPDGQQVAFASNRNGHWDLFLLDMVSGETTQFNDDAAYDGHPTWSGDGSWLAYEHMDGSNREIYMVPEDASIPPVLLSANPAADYAPAWRPGAQQIAYISTRSGLPQVWLINLELSGEDRFQPLVPAEAAQNDPAWSPDGNWLAWSQAEEGGWAIYVKDFAEVGSPVQRLGLGQRPAWSPTGKAILVELHSANKTLLTAYTVDGGLALAPEVLPGSLEGIAWSVDSLNDALPGPLAAAAQASAGDDDDEAPTPDQIIELDGVNAPMSEINSAAAEVFAALRQRSAQLLGWDALSSLDNVYVPLDSLLPPERQQDWLYTGRAFELHKTLLDAGWMAVVREQYDGQSYWRVYLRTANQESGLGSPMSDLPWDFSDRSNGSGGAVSSQLPEGYWLDFTALAADYGFERLPALSSWRTYFPGALFSQFVYRQGLTWDQAMLRLYTADEMATVSSGRP